jgi:hypothetical protein
VLHRYEDLTLLCVTTLGKPYGNLCDIIRRPYENVCEIVKKHLRITL